MKFLVGITKSLDAVVIVALLTGTVSILGIISGKICEYKYEIKEVIYFCFIDFYYDILLNEESNIKLEKMRKFSNNLMIHGSHKVIKKWSVILTKSRQGVYSNDPHQILFDTEEVFFEIRKNLGDKYNFKKGDLLQLEINDLHNIL